MIGHILTYCWCTQTHTHTNTRRCAENAWSSWNDFFQLLIALHFFPWIPLTLCLPSSTHCCGRCCSYRCSCCCCCSFFSVRYSVPVQFIFVKLVWISVHIDGSCRWWANKKKTHRARIKRVEKMHINGSKCDEKGKKNQVSEKKVRNKIDKLMVINIQQISSEKKNKSSCNHQNTNRQTFRHFFFCLSLSSFDVMNVCCVCVVLLFFFHSFVNSFKRIF